ncbi:T9SS type A sorting domain-containing protein, partial [bacterium]|nr:T9SS type A sorting domain-containing protein [bacterium]
GDTPVSLRVLRGCDEPMAVSGSLPGDSTRYLDRDVEPGVEYRYWLEVTEADSTVHRFGPTESVTVPEPARELTLSAYPNPADDAVTVAYTLPSDGRITLSVYDLSGRRVATLVDAEQTAGRHEVSWPCAGIESGVYLYRLETDTGSLTKRLVISR